MFISNARTSNSLLISKKIKEKFKNHISKLLVIPVAMLNEVNIADFDIILTDSLKSQKIPESAHRISEYIDEEDCKIIQTLLDNQERSHFKNYINKDLITIGEFKSKEDVIEKICKKAAKVYGIDFNHLYESIMEREKLGFTAYDNYIAIPHTANKVSEDTFISVGISEKPIKWDDKNIYIVILISIGSNSENYNLYDLYDSLSRFISKRDKIIELIKEPSINKFMEISEEI